MGNYNRLTDGEFERAGMSDGAISDDPYMAAADLRTEAALAEVAAEIEELKKVASTERTAYPYGMPGEVWNDLSPTGALDRAAWYVLTSDNSVPDVTTTKAVELFAVSGPELADHLNGIIALSHIATKSLFED